MFLDFLKGCNDKFSPGFSLGKSRERPTSASVQAVSVDIHVLRCRRVDRSSL